MLLPPVKVIVTPNVLTDAVLLTAAEGSGARLLTADLDLYLAALRRGRPAENVWHLRSAER